MPSTPRPPHVIPGPHTQDDGLFGPDSLTWRLGTEPAWALAGTAAAATQMLHPKVMRVIDQASSFRTHPQQRSELTGLYTQTITYGDRATAERAAHVLRKMHDNAKATDPLTGETYPASTPDLLLWVHNTLTFASLEMLQIFGPGLTADEESQYLREQLIAADLLGIPRDTVPVTRPDLHDYLDGMRPHLAFVQEAVWFRDMVRPAHVNPLNLKESGARLFTSAAITLMLDEHRELYGWEAPAWQDSLARKTVQGIFASARTKMPVDKVVPQIRHQLDLRSFGARRAA